MLDGTPYVTTHRYAQFSRTQQDQVLEPPGVGEHSRQLLRDAGVAPDQIEQLIEQGLVKQGDPFKVVAIQNYR